jgi:hypothetical protein
MEDDSPEVETKAKPSQIPSWVSLGFALGALFVIALPRHSGPDAPEPAPPEPVLRAVTPSRVSTIEAVFSDWGKFAQWNGSMTEIGLWNPETKSYSDFFEVVRMGDALYFRSIPGLTRAVTKTEAPIECPLEFAEAGHGETFGLGKGDVGALTKSFQETFGPTELPKSVPSK